MAVLEVHVLDFQPEVAKLCDAIFNVMQRFVKERKRSPTTVQTLDVVSGTSLELVQPYFVRLHEVRRIRILLCHSLFVLGFFAIALQVSRAQDWIFLP
jgi:hypothetical protein